MRQTIGATWVFQLVIIFTLIFAAYIALTINYSKSFRIKNEVISIVEKSQGFTDNGIRLVNNYLLSSGYRTMGNVKALMMQLHMEYLIYLQKLHLIVLKRQYQVRIITIVLQNILIIMLILIQEHIIEYLYSLDLIYQF